MRAALGTLLLAALAADAGAQTNDHFFRAWRFASDPLTARAAGMGGAVIALPDDTGGIEQNPANLTSLGKTEIAACLLYTSDAADE